MKLLKKITIEMLEDKTREEIEDLLLKELKTKDDTELKSQIIGLREEKIRKQKKLVDDEMKEEISKQLKLIEVIKDKESKILEKDKAYHEVLDFLKEKKDIYSTPFLLELGFVLKYAIIKKEVEAIDFLMKKRTKIYHEIVDSRLVSGLHHAKSMLKLLELDAEQGRDADAKAHIESAIKGEYDVLEFQDGAHFYSYTKSAYYQIYDKLKKELKSL